MHSVRGSNAATTPSDRVIRSILNTVPEWALLVVVVVGLPALAVSVFFVVRGRLDSWRTDSSSAIVVAVAAMVMTLFALVLAFAAVNLYQGYNDASANVTDEANALGQIQRDVRVFPVPARDRVDTQLIAYIDVVRNVEFPAMRDGNATKVQAGVVATDKLFAAMQSYDPVTETQKTFYVSAVDRMNDLIALRRNRIAASNSALPDSFTVLLLLTAGISILTTYFLRTHKPGLDVTLVVMVSVVVGAGLLTVVLLEYPFSGSVSVSVSSDPFVHGTLARLLAGKH
jgi:hypothetical protein